MFQIVRVVGRVLSTTGGGGMESEDGQRSYGPPAICIPQQQDTYMGIDRAGRAVSLIDPAGDVYPCISFYRKMGNLRDSGFSLHDLLCRPEAAGVRDLVRRGKCPACWTANDALMTILANAPRSFLT